MVHPIQEQLIAFRIGTFVALAGRILLRPRLWPLLLGAAWRFRRRGWYRRAPFLPLPPGDYLAWRLDTAYGESDAVPDLADLHHYLRWSERMRRMRHEAGHTKGPQR